ncbi:Mpv17-like protein [Cricetulus griseus]|uniref:Mpv17-like protein n=1 Tax=Cricetulus griseus TaxID=10029 RepID=G3HFN5_CRIGR|nr:Mpv17-like protein [Cricetulus griseus]
MTACRAMGSNNGDAVTFHGNFNYVWLRLLERALPGRAPRTVLAKVLCDQTVGGPIALSAFYVEKGTSKRPWLNRLAAASLGSTYSEKSHT